MERVQALAEKFKNQLAQNANKSELRQTVLLILSELDPSPAISNYPNNVSVIMPYGSAEPVAINEPDIIDLPEIKIAEKPKQIMVEKEVADHIALEPLKDLKGAIGINDKFQFIQELFGGDEKDFESSLKTINAFNIYAEAQFWIKKELRLKNNWDEQSVLVKAFDQLIKRRFS